MGRKMVDLTGKKYGKLTVIAFSHKEGREFFWEVVCDCGTFKKARGGNLKQGKSKSCGCDQHTWRKKSMHAVIDLSGKTFGRLTVIGFSHKDKSAYWTCSCTCGKDGVFSSKGLQAGSTTSCGCAQRDAVTKHGLSYHPLYGTWIDMIARCHDSKNKAFKWYGAKGVSVCERWKENPQFFFDDMGDRPKGTSLDRVDGTTGYNKDNCTWAAESQQQNNRRNNRWFSYLGKAYNLKQLCATIGCGYDATKAKLHRGKPVIETLEEGVKEITYEQAMELKGS